MLKYLLPALLSFSSAAIAEELNPENLVGLYEFDVKGSELSIYAFREISIELISLRSTGLSELGERERASLEFYNLIEEGKIIEDGEIFDERVWKAIFDQVADTNDLYDRTPMIIDRNFKFSYVNGDRNQKNRPKLCEITAWNEHDGVLCGESKGLIRIVTNDEAHIHIEIKIDNHPAQRYIKID